MTATTKPPYHVPTIAEIRALKPNGYVVASLFAGCGGSSTGYRMAGFQVAYANDVVAEARDSYRANAADYTVIDGTDVREVKGETILDAVEALTGSRELDVLDGSPPCQAFSTAGPRDKTWGREVAHSDGTTQRSDDLFFEYARILRETRPKVFVAENVTGLVKGKARGYFFRILKTLRAAGYRVEVRRLDAEWLGVPQMRQRIIFVGVREDLGLDPAFPTPLPYNYTMRDAVPDALRVEGAWYGGKLTNNCRTRPSHTITASGYSACGDHTLYRDGGKVDRLTIDEIKALSGFPPDFILTGSYAQAWARVGNSVPPLLMRAVAETIRDEILDKVDHG